EVISSVFEIGGISSNIEISQKEKQRVFENELVHLKADFEIFKKLHNYESSRSHHLLNKTLIFLGYRRS
ncbi:hypothetical protein, partial [Rubrolithibacter danxiaensis]|uniref:hypothetical protein n=1 Tax=Rubrolithibacter danxiaensis TaxID=3390805 RepID=UPI003BF8EAE7